MTEPVQEVVDAPVEKDKLQGISDDITARARVLVDKDYSITHLMNDIYIDFKGLGNVQNLLQFVSTGKLTPAQLQKIEKIAVKVLAVVTKVK